jgi:hypothetical protein
MGCAATAHHSDLTARLRVSGGSSRIWIVRRPTPFLENHHELAVLEPFCPVSCLPGAGYSCRVGLRLICPGGFSSCRRDTEGEAEEAPDSSPRSVQSGPGSPFQSRSACLSVLQTIGPSKSQPKSIQPSPAPFLSIGPAQTRSGMRLGPKIFRRAEHFRPKVFGMSEKR